MERWQAGLVGLCGIAAAAGVPPAAAEPPLFPEPATRQLDAAIDQAAREHNLPSAAIGIRIPGQGSYLRVVGAADLQTGARRTADQPFRIASLTKTFTATAILLLVDRGQLRKTDPVSTWFPGFPDAARITLDDLLRMRSGIASPSDETLMEQVYDDPLAAAPSLSEQMAQSAALAAQFKAPGQESVYSNLGYLMLGGILEAASGQTPGAFITTNIVERLGLSGTSYPTGFGLPGGLHGYGWDAVSAKFQDKTEFNPALAGTAGAMTSTVADLQTYVVALCTGALLTPATQAARMAAQTLVGSTTAYGEGLINSDGVCGHSGTIPGFNTDMYYLEKSGAAVVVSVNRLDRDDKPQTTPILKLAIDAVTAQFGPL